MVAALSQSNCSQRQTLEARWRRECAKRLKRCAAYPHIANVVALRDAFVTPEFVALVLDYCAGGNLGALLAKENGRFEAPVAWHFAKQLADGLQFLHQHHVIHRDLKPENLLLSRCAAFAQLRVADFGFARSMEESTQMLTSVLGTPYYMAPELLARKQYDYRSDLWSFGAILYEMLVGRRAWPGVGSFEALQHAHARPVSFPKGLAVSPLAHKLLVERLLVVDVAARVTPTDFFG
jgi:serine/threonine protein kinase